MKVYSLLAVFLFINVTRADVWWRKNKEILSRAGIPKGSKLPPPNLSAECIVIDETVGVDNGLENSLWYMREDFAISGQHFFWHVMNGMFRNETPINRGGELFTYFHRNILARYDAERLANGLPRTVPLDYSQGAIIEDGYNPHLNNNNTVYTYVARPPGSNYINHNYTSSVLDILLEDIERGRLIALNGSFIAPTTDMLGNVVEASTESVNPDRYTWEGVHNRGHESIGMIGADLVTMVGVMLVPSVAMRDPVFYRWHLIVDDIFYRHQKMLEPHHPTEGDFPLIWTGISVDAVSVKREGSAEPNALRTYFEHLNASMPLLQDFFLVNETLNYCMDRLNHEEFFYNITITRAPFVTSDQATIRIFMSPRFNESGSRFDLTTQHRQFFAMDHFITTIPVGTSVITRKSNESNLLSHWRFENWMENTPSQENPECGCGWPAHLLLPRGTTEGMAFDLFVMVTDAKIDLPKTVLKQTPQKEEKQEPFCKYGSILCGVKEEVYPDLRPMNYPFDTLPFSITEEGGNIRPVHDLDEYVGLIPNAGYTQVSIHHDA